VVIIRLSGVGAKRQVHVALDRSPFNLPQDEPDTPLRCGPAVLKTFAQDPPESDVVLTVGTKLFRSLERHPTVRLAVESALARPQGYPIYLRLDSVEAAEYPWESLFDTARQRFLALYPETPIGRIVPASYHANQQYVAAPLRLVAILSAAGVDASGEWRSLRRAIERTGVDVEVRVVVGQHSLHQEIKANTPSWAKPVLLSNDAVINRVLKEFNPHFVHFFCHGAARPNPLLELATPLAHAAKASDLHVTPASLKGVAPMPLLVTLNCCSGASDVDGVRGLASELVLNADYPAAIGMREPIEATDAHVFAESFYSEVFDQLNDVFANGQPVELEWAGALCGARLALRKLHAEELMPDPAAARHRKWTVPILCRGPAPLTLEPVTIHPSHGDKVENAAKVFELNSLARMSLGQPPAVQIGALTRIEQIRAELGAAV
jgi:hypothetical protein